MSVEVHFAVQGAEGKSDPIHHIAIQAAALMLCEWMKESDPDPDEAQAMVEAVVKGLMGRSPPSM